MRGPSLADLRLHMGESGARRWIGNADKVVAGRALDLPTGVARIALQWLIAVGTIEFEFGCAHKLQAHHAQTSRKKYIQEFSSLRFSECGSVSRRTTMAGLRLVER